MVMIAIIYTTQQSADLANDSLKELNHKPVEYIGEGPFVEPEPKPYSNVLKHPTLNKWALISNPEIETFLNKTSEVLSSDWFNNEI